MAPEIEAMRAEARRKHEVWIKEYEIAEDKRKRAENKQRIEQSIKDSRQHLEQIIGQWTETQGIIRFLQGVEDAALKLPPDDGEVMLARLQLARAFLGDQDPLKHFLRWRLPGELDESGFERG